MIGSWDSISKFHIAFMEQRLGSGARKLWGISTDHRHINFRRHRLIIAVPISFGIATFLTELSPQWLKRPIGTAVEMLAAIPSIIYGMWGLFVFVPLFSRIHSALYH